MANKTPVRQAFVASVPQPVLAYQTAQPVLRQRMQTVMENATEEHLPPCLVPSKQMNKAAKQQVVNSAL
tara:strand:+ start:94 stop:300 length:207 start_codon:yes stop_codon:yes gene_type:complete